MILLKKNNNESMWRNGLRIHIESKVDYGGNFSFVSFFGKGKEAFNCLKNEAGFTQCIKFRSNAYCGKLNLIYAIYVNIFI